LEFFVFILCLICGGRAVVGKAGVGGGVVDAAAHVAVDVVLVLFGAVAVEEVRVVGEVDVGY
jgi:hypothetical protein